MISIVAPNIKSGGGLELLLYLLEYIEKKYPALHTIVYVDASLKMIKPSQNIKVVHIKSSLEKIKLFTKKIDNALYFGNLPPLRKSSSTIVYFHNLYLLMPLSELMKTSIKFFVKYLLQQVYIKYFVKNVDMVACQNENIKRKFIEKYSSKNVEVIPFFRLCDRELLKVTPKVYDFCYVSLAHPHKNHKRLLEACEMLSNERITFSLALTVEDTHEELLKQIDKINQKNIVKIINLGLLSKQDVCKLYAQSKCLVFASTQETFGLGLIEAVNMDVDVIASNLSYVYQAIEPSAVFDPLNSRDIGDKMRKYLEEDMKKSKQLIENDIDRLMQFFTKEKNVQK